jgi:phospholipid/cholesterol/gamma-HCH transport system permease protein
LKSFFFGGIIAVVSCYRGFNCRAGAEGVGQAATAAFVMSFVLILGIDLVLNILLETFYYAVWAPEASL